MEKAFPKVNDHWSARCFHCGHPLDGRPVDSGNAPGSGQYRQKCNACDHHTFYDMKGA